MPSNPIVDKTQTPRMFSAIAHRYDLLNHVLSANVDRRWRRKLVEMAAVPPGGAVLDAATGTADVAIEFSRRSAAGRIAGLDLSSGMLAVGSDKLRDAGLGDRIGLVEADVMRLPYAGDTFDAVTIAFGLRNLPDYAAGVAEMARVLRPGGRLLILEFFPPRTGLFLRGYRFYLGSVLPLIGRVVSGSREAYRYLARSIEDFVPHADMRAMMTAAGLADVEPHRLTGGIAFIYTGRKP